MNQSTNPYKILQILTAPASGDNPPIGSVYQWMTVVDAVIVINTKQHDGTVGTVSGGTIVETLLFRVPTMEDNSALHFALEVHDTSDYSGTAIESFNSSTAQTNLSISNGEEWLAFPAEGVGNPYYSEKLAVALQSVVPGTQYYVRYKWFIAGSDPDDTPWYLSQYPVLEINNLPDKNLPVASFALVSPDTSIWDVTIENDGTITRTKRV